MSQTVVNSIVSTIDMSLLPPPDFVKMPLFSDTKASFLARLRSLDADFNALVESDPAMKLLEVAVYYFIVNYARTNQGQLAVLLAFAKNSDLTQLGANFDVPRLVITPANPDAIPPTAAVYEDDDPYRHRIQLSWYARNTAGSTNAYNYLALSADADVLSAQAYGPPVTSPGYVDMYILSRTGDGTAPQALLNTVNAALSPDDTRPLTDCVTVKPAANIDYVVTAQIVAGLGPDSNTILSAARTVLADYVASVHRINGVASLSGIYDAIHMSGVERVILTSPAADIISGVGQAPYCTAMNLSITMS